MQTGRGTSIMRPTRSIARPGVTSTSSCEGSREGPMQVHAAVLPPSGVLPPMAVLQLGGLEPLVMPELTLRIWKLLFESMMTDGKGNAVFGRQPFVLICPSLVQTMAVPSFTEPPGAVANVIGALPLVPACPVLT